MIIFRVEECSLISRTCIRTRGALPIWTQLHVGEKCVGEPDMIEGIFANVSQFKEAVKFKLKEALTGIGAFQLCVHQNEEDRRGNRRLPSGHPIVREGYTDSMPIVAVAPDPLGAVT